MTDASRDNKLPYVRIALFGVFFIGVLVAINLASGWITDLLKMEIGPKNEHIFHWIIMGSLAFYTVLIAIPFVPGVEIGIALIMMVGPGLIALIYACTIVGLFVSFLIGTYVPQDWIKRAFLNVGFKRAGNLIDELERLPPNERVALLVARAPSRWLPFLLRWRYVALALAINIPGNALIGGGGGISLAAGLSRLYSPPLYLLTLLVAVAPIPVAIFVFGTTILS